MASGCGILYIPDHAALACDTEHLITFAIGTSTSAVLVSICIHVSNFAIIPFGAKTVQLPNSELVYSMSALSLGQARLCNACREPASRACVHWGCVGLREFLCLPYATLSTSGKASIGTNCINCCCTGLLSGCSTRDVSVCKSSHLTA